MKLLNYFAGEEKALRLGVKLATGILDVAAAAGATGADAPGSMEELIAGGPQAAAALQALADANAGNGAMLLDEGTLSFAPCVTLPEKILCVGLNYRRHAAESGMAAPETPVLFSKFNNSLSAHGDQIVLPPNAVQYDYEVELGVVIGREARYVATEDALNCVFGYCTANDVSARDLQMTTSQWLLGKTLDDFMPIGPYLFTADEVPDPQDLRLRCWVNGDLRQDSSTSDMIFSVAEVISYASQYMTLKPGDFITTGTPEGVILGMAEKNWLCPGDEVSVEVGDLGRLSNTMA